MVNTHCWHKVDGKKKCQEKQDKNKSDLTLPRRAKGDHGWMKGDHGCIKGDHGWIKDDHGWSKGDHGWLEGDNEGATNSSSGSHLITLSDHEAQLYNCVYKKQRMCCGNIPFG